ncbi:hypothetical protein [Chroococcidiopsis sp. CCMEE 29]|uniref:hypothetical protein n=1 Tax=Chroococcidiopsis sp. CCMEE 29 TaxID=155894 RepID=UPI00202209BF|nr:hypothetical protein [Chroococcidiopsis sp. CCMEE 29]
MKRMRGRGDAATRGMEKNSPRLPLWVSSVYQRELRIEGSVLRLSLVQQYRYSRS